MSAHIGQSPFEPRYVFHIFSCHGSSTQGPLGAAGPPGFPGGPGPKVSVMCNKLYAHINSFSQKIQRFRCILSQGNVTHM